MGEKLGGPLFPLLQPKFAFLLHLYAANFVL